MAIGIPMVEERNLKTPGFVQGVLWLLAIAVVSWGLQAKLSLYQGNTRALAPVNSSAKLTSGETPDPAENVVKARNHHAELVSIHILSAAWTALHQDRTSVVERSDLRPAWKLRLATSGPNLGRRPPPSLS